MKLYKNAEWLREQYVDKRRHIDDIGKECGAAGRTVATWTKRFGLTRRRYGSYSVNDGFFECIDSEKKAYWLGFIAADGCVMNRPGKRILSVCLAAKDESHLEKLRSDMQCEKRIYTRKDGAVQLDICSETMMPDLIKHGVHPRKSKTLKAPELSEDLVHHWIRGYFDGDGSVRVNGANAHVEIVGTKVVMEFIRKSINLFVSNKFRNGVYHIRIHGNRKASKLANFLYESATSFLPRKRKIFQEVCHF